MLDVDSSVVENLADGGAVFADAWCRGWTLPEPLRVSDWADRHRIISRKAGAEPGPWRTDRFPFLREIMDCFSVDSPVREVDFMKSTQVGGTEVLNNVAGYIIDHSPGPAMVLMPTLGLAELWSKQRLGPMLEEMECLRSKVAPARSRDADNTTMLKGFPGGVLSIVGANSTVGLRSMPVKALLADEIDEYEDDLNEQGSVLEMAERRTSTFSQRKIGRISTPTVKGHSKIEAQFLSGDQRRYHVPCPFCGTPQVLVIDQLTDEGEYCCIGCGGLIAEHHKARMLADGEWVPGRPDADPRHRSYHIWAAYSPIGVGYSWVEIAAMRAKAKKDPDLEVTFANTILGETYDSATMRVAATEIAQRAEEWKLRTIQPGVLLLTVGVDVQIDRFEVLLMGWGRSERGWFVDWVQLPADPTDPESYDQLDDFMDAALLNRFGVSMRPCMGAIDSGNWTHEVYSFVRRSRHPWMAVKGLSTSGRQIIHRPKPQDVKRNGRTIRHGVNLWTIGVNTAKTTLVGRMAADEDRELDDRWLHFAEDLPEDFYEQLTAETYDERSGRWKKIRGRRNEALDCLIYAYAAALHPKIHLHKNREPEWARLEAIYEPPVGDMFQPGAKAADADDSRGTKLQPAPRQEPIAVPSPEADETFGADEWSRRL